MNTEIIAQFKPKNNANFPVVDTLDIKGGYLPFQTLDERNTWTSNYSNRLTVGQLAHVSATGYYYNWNGKSWEEAKLGSGGGGNGNVYIQDTQPLDSEAQPKTDSIWIDTSNKGLNTENSVVSSLLKMINILSSRVSQLEYLNQQIQSGDFSNNMYNEYDAVEAIEPDMSTQEEDDAEEELYSTMLLADSPEPDYKTLPNVKHIQIKYGSYTDMQKYKDNFLPAELLWCYDKKQLWIKDPKTYKLYQIGASSSTVTPDPTDPTDDIMNGIIQKGDYIGSISFVDMTDSTKHYTFGVSGGELSLYDESLNTETKNNAQTILKEGSSYYKTPYLPTDASDASATNSLLFINQVYSTGTASDSAYSLCNYEFIELANITQSDINLNGLFLHYTEGAPTANGREWITLPLKGVIKSGSTFLIKCARCGQDKYAKLHVGKPDMYWTKDNTLKSDVLDTDTKTIWADNVLNLASNCSLLLTGPLYSGTTDKTAQEVTSETLATTAYVNASPWLSNSDGIGVCYGYIDLIGFGTYNDGTDDINMPCVSAPCASLTNNKLYLHYYDMDNVSQAYKSVITTDWANNKIWTYINLDLTNPEIDLDWYQPKNSSEGKTIFYNKHLLEDGAPTFITCTFGFNPHTTRCFTWVTKGYRDEYLRYRKKGETTWTTVESFKEGDKRETIYNRDNAIYNRIRSFTTDGTYFTAHKVIIDLYAPFENGKLTDGPSAEETYEYQAGYNNYWTDTKEFTLRNRQDIIKNGFKFVQVTDQQGFNAEEYKTWEISADYIYKNEDNIDFGINTGDATQNGNRINEWVDYFKAGYPLFDHMEQQFTVGNNDLCPAIPYQLGLGTDATKVNPINVQYFFTYEHPNAVPTSSAGVYVPSVYSFVYGNTYFLSMNSEITNADSGISNPDDASGKNYTADQYLFGEQGASLYGTTLKAWCEKDLSYIESLGVTPDWKIAFCHENPFTLLIKTVVTAYKTAKDNYEKDPTNATYKDAYDQLKQHRGTVTSHLNIPGGFWFSKFLEDNKFNLSICGHKHTFTSSYYLRDNEEDRMQPYIFQEGNITLTDDQKVNTQLSEDDTQWYVKYSMCQATGYKTISNKELPANNIGWLETYYPSDSNKSNANVKLQRFPFYIVWSVGKGTETETEETVAESRDRILGKVRKLYCNKYGTGANSSTTNKPFNYNTNVCTSADVTAVNGNGLAGNTDILVLKTLFGK